MLYKHWMPDQVRHDGVGYLVTKLLSLHPRSGWAQEAPLKEVGISNIEYRLHEFRSDGSQLIKQRKIERSDTTLQYSTFLVRHSIFSFLIFTGSVELSGASTRGGFRSE
jgi:hypothetical protein